MATNTQDLPTYIRVATIYGVVVLRRTKSTLWAGRGLRKLSYAKNGFLSAEREVLEWSEVNSCMVCMESSTLTIQWSGRRCEKPRKANGAAQELQGMAFTPVKVMDTMFVETAGSGPCPGSS